MNTENSNVDKWKDWYKNLDIKNPIPYGDSTTYVYGADFLKDVDTVEDWGCGMGFFSTHCQAKKYIGIDGSDTPFAHVKADLTKYTSSVDGIFMRHILEHNYEWEKILKNAVSSFTKKMVLILFTPYSEQTRQLTFYEPVGVPDISFKKSDITDLFVGCEWFGLDNLKTQTVYGVEHIFFLTKKN